MTLLPRPFVTIKWQLVVACPHLMSTLSRTGNALHGVARVETSLHTCNRLHGMASSMCVEGVIDWEAVALHASHGQDPDFTTKQKRCATSCAAARGVGRART